MTEFSGTWSPEAVATFLQGVTIPIRIATRRADGSIWPVTVWYRYRDGQFECATHADSALVGLVKGEPDVGFDVSTNDVPYSGVRGYGRVTVSSEGAHEVLRDLVEGLQLLVVGEYLLLVEPPSAEADAHFRHVRSHARRG